MYGMKMYEYHDEKGLKKKKKSWGKQRKKCSSLQMLEISPHFTYI